MLDVGQEKEILSRIPPWPILLIFIFAGMTSACTGGRTTGGYSISTGGDPHRGQAVIVQFRCGACHTIPGIKDANGVFGPPLNWFARRTYIAGNFPNVPDQLVSWILSPPSMKPKTAMPQLGLTDQQARDAAAYLYTLR